MGTASRTSTRHSSRLGVLVNAAGAMSGGGRVYPLALAHELAQGGDRGIRWEVLVQPRFAGPVAEAGGDAVRVREVGIVAAPGRITWEQLVLPGLLRRWNVDVLLSTVNFGPIVRRNGHVLLARNALHFAGTSLSGKWGLRLSLERALARASIKRAQVTVTASEAMGAMVRASTGVTTVTIPFGAGLIERQTAAPRERFTFLHRTSWGPHKRLIDLLLAARKLAQSHPDRFLIRSACDPRTNFARQFPESIVERELLRNRDVAAHVEFLSFDFRVPDELNGDAVVMASPTESFCFPLAEAVGAGVPAVAVDAPFAREVCGDAAIYVRACEPEELADGMRRLLEGERPPPYPDELRSRISWARHVDELAALCRRVGGA